MEEIQLVLESLPAYFKQVNQYLNEYNVEAQMQELLKAMEI